MKYLFFILIGIFLLGISCHNEFKSKPECPSQNIVPSLVFYINGYPFSNLRNILVKEYDKSKFVDSFYMNAKSYVGDSILMRYSVTTSRPLNINYIYKIYISNFPPYTLSNMKILPVEHYSSFGREWQCIMSKYDLDGVTYNDINPMLIKRSLK